ncbi:MAG TPA: CHRD domain-containing protein [Casimicrobiaceae bacterium]|nr:CHRD domain-containing protein [Casimicrobiaceae bacterium]
MKNLKQKSLSVVIAAAAAGMLALTGSAYAEKVTLSGGQEVPPVQSSGSATGDVNVAADGSVTGSIKVTGFTPTAAHIHQGASNAYGPVIVPMTKQGDDTFVFPAGAKMTPEQLAAYKAGNTFINVHSAAHKDGEVRAQLTGK